MSRNPCKGASAPVQFVITVSPTCSAQPRVPKPSRHLQELGYAIGRITSRTYNWELAKSAIVSRILTQARKRKLSDLSPRDCRRAVASIRPLVPKADANWAAIRRFDLSFIQEVLRQK